MTYQFSEKFALELDANDPLAKYRNAYHIPKHGNSEKIYFTGNSLGLQPKGVKQYLQQEMDDWANFGVDGHFEAKRPWYSYHELFHDSLSKIVGAKPNEVVAMNVLTVNLHLLMVSFYRPKGKRIKILAEGKAFPSDHYALASQVRFHGYTPEEAIEYIEPREGEHTIRPEDIYKRIEELGDSLALVMFGGVNYYTGQVLPMKEITEKAHTVGAFCGFDLAHGAGNIPLQLHNWNVDFACWCSYKYMNSGPGGVSGAYINEKHHTDNNIPRFEGWWGTKKETRFEMNRSFDPMQSAEAWQLSNAPVFSMAPHRAALDVFDEVGMEALRNKSLNLTGYLAFILNELSALDAGVEFEIITPQNENERGCQLSVLMHGKGKEVFQELTEAGVIADWREPNVIRMAPVPMYNSFMDIYRFGEIMKRILIS